MIDQIMGGTTSRSTTYSDTQRSNPQAPSPPYTRDDFRSFQPHDHSAETSPRARPLQHPPQAPPPPQQQQQQPPSPRRSMFEFTSPFDHLSSSTGSIKKKAVPPQPSNVSSGNEDSSWTSVTDPKRQSVENLLENMTRGLPQQSQPQPPAYESYLSSDYSQGESAPIRAPLPPIPASKPVSVPIPIPNVTGSPRGGSPKGQPLHRPQPRAAEVNNNQQATYPGAGGRRDKDSSPGPRGRGGAPRTGQPGPKFSKPRSPSPQSQTIIFDVSQPLEEILARDAVKSTAIALVRQDSVFLPGTTIGATHWVAYAMTRGRVRVISRSSGDRTLLQLPQIFSQASSVIDMAVYGNRLAGVTSDGGFVVWELPELITDDVPGRILLCVPPTNDSDAIRAVKWHPKDPDTLAIASDNQIYVIDLANTHALHGQPLPHSDLHHIGQPFNVPSTVVAFDFDVVHHALATISEDSSLTIWNMHDSLPYAVHKIRGEDIPSSLTFVDGGIVVGRRNGTTFQLLSMTNKSILSTIKFINSAQEDPDMFGHISYDSRIQTLWVANSRRESLIALKVHIEPSFATGEESVRGWIEQVAEFTGIKPTIHFVILTADADPHGDEALAACVAAKVPPGELALVAFSVHSSGVDQVLIRREWFDQALASAESKLPPIDIPTPYMPLDNKPQLQRAPLPIPPAMSQPSSVQFAPPRNRTPPSDDVDNEFGSGDQKGRGVKGKNVNWKEKEEINKDKASKSSELSIVESSALGQALTKEMKKTEDNLHNRIGRLINKEMDKQHQRLEEARLHEQAEDFARQEKILKLISTELTRNTTRVVEMAVKTEIQNSVLPALETMTKTELKTAFNEQVASTLADLVSRQLPPELEKSLLRSSISNHYAGLLSSNLAPAIERQIKEILTTNFFQFHAQQTANMQQDLTRELRSELSLMKSEFAKWHSESLRNHEVGPTLVCLGFVD
ncbi:hypothetical protein NLJ89_g11306 [Agrocybe chaxingu]|uniref:Enhancer of mRNA-decapping protein 4 WD40 repeat region domain-containing protein n=1 Tax=Agrocybe chaxingu TaxID=84603 RepID=A0A9W8MQ46_9AGAR|nr:hypothetical protein NLJ89_g11306 [Agrocybe chaxingu]